MRSRRSGSASSVRTDEEGVCVTGRVTGHANALGHAGEHGNRQVQTKMAPKGAIRFIVGPSMPVTMATLLDDHDPVAISPAAVPTTIAMTAKLGAMVVKPAIMRIHAAVASDAHADVLRICHVGRNDGCKCRSGESKFQKLHCQLPVLDSSLKR